MNTIILKIAGLPVERMDISPNHSVRVLAVVAWDVIAVDERAGGQIMNTTLPWHCGTAWSRADFH